MTIKILSSTDPEILNSVLKQYSGLIVRLPNVRKNEINLFSKNTLKTRLYKICQISNYLTSQKGQGKTIVFIGPLHVLPFVYQSVHKNFKFHDLVAIRLKNIIPDDNFLPNEHLGLMVFSTKQTRVYNTVKVPYEFCKSCKNTVKDYGGKTHLLNRDGTRISDVWKHIPIDGNVEFPKKILNLIEKLLRNDKSQQIAALSLSELNNYEKLNLKELNVERMYKILPTIEKINSSVKKLSKTNILLNSDVLTGLKKIPDNSIDLALIDPPYNLAITYGKFKDNMKDNEYYTWTKQWIDQIFRILSKNGLLFLVNIPRWSLELFPYLLRHMTFRGWIVWDAWSMPHGDMIPAHYPILCFSKSKLTKLPNINFDKYVDVEFANILPLNYGYCLRDRCLKRRTDEMKNDRKEISDLWTDIHRIRHNSFRYNHPTLMPQKLARRIIHIFSKENSVILDCFNGVGTTTLVAQKLNRKYVGIEKNYSYHKTSVARHKLLSNGGDPFERANAKSTSLNKGYRLIKYQTHVQKKVLQLEVKNVAKKLGHCPTKIELAKHGKYPMKYYYDNFRDWAEVTVATRRTGLQIR